jgi:hypothetical protein
MFIDPNPPAGRGRPGEMTIWLENLNDADNDIAFSWEMFDHLDVAF